uniref:GDPGP1-like C-terminal domain-containing protein n=1 Tax=Nelumbo nucifera TaxID=4432 RepID=A0A822ZS14_NELNU|nr:TPA_asm: hypothetical protein HUJ06_017207 [Nelumbo nucifera]
MVLKRKQNYEEATEENAWRLHAEASLSEGRFQEVIALIFEAIACNVDANGNITQSIGEKAADGNQGTNTTMTHGKHECLVQY